MVYSTDGKIKMTNTRLKRIKTNNKIALQHAGLDSISTDLTHIKDITKILIKQIQKESSPKNMEGIVINDALYTSLFIKYRRCFNKTGRRAGLNKKHVSLNFLKLHEYLMYKANQYYAHAFDIKLEVTVNIDQETNKIKGFGSTEIMEIYPLNKKYLEQLNLLADNLLRIIFEKQKKIKTSNKLLHADRNSRPISSVTDSCR